MNHYTTCHFYLHARDQSIVDEITQSLLRYPVGEGATSVVAPRRPVSFEVPFDNPVLEPVPLKANSTQEARDFSLSSSTIAFLRNIDSNLIEPTSVKKTQPIYSPPSSCGSASLEQHPEINQLISDVEEGDTRFRPFQDEKWNASYQRLLKFKQKFGHCCVPHSYEEDRALARWVKRQRHQYKKFKENDPTSTLTPSRLEQLEAVGFVWHSHAAAWMDKLNELKAFKASKGHCNVPSTYPENSALSTWVKSQRRQYKLFVSNAPSTMTMLRYRVLKSMGFVFDPMQTTCKKNFVLDMQH